MVSDVNLHPYIKLKRQKSKIDNKLEYNRSKTLKLLNSAYEG